MKPGWTEVALGDISERVDYGVSESAVSEPVGPRYLRITDIQDDRVEWSALPWCRTSDESKSKALLAPGDIVFARTGATTGKSYLIKQCPEDTVFASYLIRVRTSNRALPAYVAHYFRSPGYWAQITRRARGAGQPGVNSTSLRGLVLPLPPLEEQKRIAAILDKAGELQAKRRAAIAHLDSLTQAIFLDMFGNDGLRAPGTALVSFADLLEVPLRNGVSPSSRGSFEGRVLTLTAITRDRFLPSAVKTALFDSHFSQQKVVDGRDMLICRGNGNVELVGRARFPVECMHDTAFPDTMIAARVSPASMLPRFLESAWMLEPTRRQIIAGAHTTNGTYKVNQQLLESILVPVPPIDAQATFAERARRVSERSELAAFAAEQLNDLKTSLQAQAFRGEL